MRKFYYLGLLMLFTCWQVNAQVYVSENFDSGTPTGWTDTYDNSGTESCAGNSERDNLYASSSTGNITTPNYAGASNGTDLNVSFDYKVVDYFAATNPTAAGWGTAELQYSTDDGATWTTAYTIDDTNHVVAASCATVSATIPAASLPTGSDVKLQIANTWAAGDYYFYVDNFSAEQTISCYPVSNIAVSAITPNTADVSWTAGASETLWNIEVVESGTAPTGTPTDTGVTNPFTLTNLTSSTTYEVYVQADCGGGDTSTWAGPITFTTACDPFTVTYTQNFDAESTPDVNQCWTAYVENATSTYANVQSSSTQSVSASNSMRFYNSSDNDGTYILASPAFSDLDNTKRIKFNMYKNIGDDADGDVIEVGTMSDATDSSTFTVYQTLTAAEFTEDEWTELTVNFDTYTGTDTYIAFKYVPGTGDYSYWYFDDFVYEEIPSCLEPSDLAVSGITINSAVIAWTAGDAETLWNIEVVESGTAPTGTPTYSGVTNPYTITNLDSGTYYDVYVQADCVSSTSPWVGPLTFITNCDAFTATYTQNFDEESTPDVNICWTAYVENATSTYANVISSTTQSVSASNGIRFYNSSDTSGTYILATPEFSDLDNTKRIKFQMHKNIGSDSEGDSFEIGTMTDPTDSSTFTTFQTLAASDFTEDAWEEFIINFDTYTGTDSYIAFKYVPGTGGYNYWYFDDFVYENIPSCVDPTDLMVDDTTATGVDFSWTAGGTETDWEYVIQPAGTGEPTGSGTAVTGSPMASDTSLTFNTDYEIYIRANCGGDYSPWVGPVNFTTYYCESVPTSNDGSGITNVNFQGTDFPNGDVTYFDHTATVIDITQGNNAQMNIDFATGFTYDTNIWIDFNDNLEFESSELVFDGNSTNANPTNLDTSFLVPSNAAIGEHYMRVGTADSGQGTPNPCYSGSYGVTLDFKVNVVEPPAVFVDWANLQSFVVDVDGVVSAVTEIETCQDVTVYSQGWEDGVTNADATAPGAGISVWIAYSSDDTDPSTWDDALWMPATYNADVGNNDEFQLVVSGLAAGTYYFASRWQLDNGQFVYGVQNGFWDGSANMNAPLTVSDPDPVTITADVMEICPGESATLTASSDNTDYTYEWDTMETTTDITVTPTETTTYMVTATNPNTGCTATASMTIVVNVVPTDLTITPDPAVVCNGGDPLMLTVEGGLVDSEMIEDFETAPLSGWAFYQSESDDPGFVQTDLQANGGTYSFYHNDDQIAAISDSWMVSPALMVGETGEVSFFYRNNYTPTYYEYSGVMISTTGSDPLTNPGDYVELQELDDSEDAWTEYTYDLSSYANQTVYIAFKYTGDWSTEFFVDDFNFNTSSIATFEWTPTTDLYLDEAMTMAYAGESVMEVYAAPTAETVYTVTATSPAGCTSSADITVSVQEITDAPVADAAQSFCSADMATIADLVATGDNLSWYDAATDGNMLMDTDVLVDGTSYFVSAMATDQCESDRVEVMVTINDTPGVPVADAAQTFCSEDMATIADLVAIGDNLVWYDAATDGNMLMDSDALVDGTSYFVEATSTEGCSTERVEVMVTINDTPDAPTADTVQEFCPDDMPTVADLMATGDNIMWYDAATDGNMLMDSDALVDGMFYYAEASSAEGCVNSTRAIVAVDFDTTLCAEGNTDCDNAVDLTVDGAAVSGNTNNTSDEMFTACDSDMTDGVWYTVEGDGADLTVSVSPSDWDAQLAILEGDCAGGFMCMDTVNDNGVGGAEEYTFPSTAGTVYYILVGSSDGSSEGEFAIQVESNLDIEDISEMDSSITLYPNPVTDKLFINVDQEVKNIQVYSFDGSLVKEFNQLTDNAIDVQNLSSGSYIIRVYLEDGSNVTEKFIKK